MNLNYDFLKQSILRKGYKFFQGELNLNLIGIRNKNNINSNGFNDSFFVVYEKSGIGILECFACTTDPGVYYRENPENVNGTAILAAAQHIGIWQLGYHKGKYRALVQKTAARMWRDDNKDAKLDFKNMQTCLAGINCHKAGENSSIVDKWSAGCQVIAKDSDFNVLIELCEDAASRWGNSFTYTLLESDNL